MTYAALILLILSFSFEHAFALQNHFKNQLLGSCPEAELSFTSPDSLRVVEGAGVINLGISLTRKACADMQVEYGYYATSGTVIGTHVSAGVSGMVTIPKGQKTATISFSVLQNAVSETEKAVFISLRGGKSTRQKIKLNANATKGVLIADDESTYGTINKVATSGLSMCIIIDGVLKCWGANSSGSVGNGTTTYKATPTIINAGTSFSTVTMGSGGAACAITGSSGILKCWGLNFGSALGDGTALNKTSPTTIDSGTSYSQVSVGHNHGCGITTANVLKCWGGTNNNGGQVGDGLTTGSTTPKVISSGTTYTQVSVYGYNNGITGHSCAITSSGELQCWGVNNNGQVGDNTIVNKLSPVAIDVGVSYTVVRSGGDHACGITTSGELKCWGDNSKGQLGDGTLTDRRIPTGIDSGQTYLDVALGDTYTCAITTGSKLKCWGDNSSYNLGNWSNVNERLPIVIDSNENYTSVFLAGGSFLNSAAPSACAITTAGRLKCWGSNVNGQFVLDTASSYGDVRIREINSSLSFASVSVGGHSSCGITPTNDLYCWGANYIGQLGDRTTIGRDYPVKVDSGVKYLMVDVSSGAVSTSTQNPHACGITTAGILKCWGANSDAKLGDGTMVQKNKPKVIDSGVTYSYVATGFANTCAITTGGALKCWGDNSNGQLGIGSTVDQTTPTVVASGTTYSSVDVSDYYDNLKFHTCAITTTGELQCWGSNSNGQLGNGTTSAITVKTPETIDAGESYSTVKVGNAWTLGYTCGLTTTNKVKCWGGNNANGSLGVGDASPRTSPTPVDATTDYIKLSSKGYNSCAITSAGKLRCWGDNFYSMVGDGTVTDRLAPVDVDNSKTYIGVEVGDTTTQSSICAIEASTLKLRCWGYNSYGSNTASPRIIGAPTFIPQVQVP